MKAMILTAGLGTRLRPLTLERAKPAIPLLGKPLVLRLVEGLAVQGAKEFRLNLHHLPETVERVFETAPDMQASVSFSYETEILGTAGGLKANEAFFDSGTFIMVNGDIIADFDITPALKFHKVNGALATMLLMPQAPPFRFFPVRIDNSRRLVDFKGCNENGTPTDASYVFTGAHIIEPDIFDYIPSGVFWEINDQVYPAAIHNGARVLGFPVTGYWNDLGDPKRYLQAQRDLLQRRSSEERSYVADTARISPEARIGPFASLESGCSAEAGARVSDAVLWDGVRIGSGVTVSNCIVGSGVELTEDCYNRVMTRNGEIAIEPD
jgi:NDP-sugar pyrophosphorylase family protein